MAAQIQAIRGMNDILPDATPAWLAVEDAVRAVAEGYGYQQIRLPIVEQTALFARSIGEVTDIVEKEMYTFDDRSGESLTLRPEGTAGCVRAALQHGLLGQQSQKLWYIGPMFRYERPQKGRYRQFHQIGLEVFGLPGPDIDVELLLLTARLWRRLGMADAVELQLNSLGTPEARAQYRDILVDYLRQHYDRLDEDSQRRLESNPLRILDSKNPELQPLIEAAPRLADHLDDASRNHFEQLCARLDACGIAYRINPRLVRGLDYYSATVFEWVTDRLGAQGAVCAGGRYDGLVTQLGGKPVPAIGCAIGLERLVALLPEQTVYASEPHAWLAVLGDVAEAAAMPLAEQLRDAVPGLRLQVNCGGGSFKSQLKKADRSGAAVALLLGEDEAASATLTLKPLRDDAPQQRLSIEGVVEYLIRLSNTATP